MRRALIGCLFTLLVTVGFSGFQAQGKVIHGVVVAGVPLGGLSYSEARAALDYRAQQFNEQRIILTFQDSTWQPTLAELGVTLDTETAWSQILSFGSSRHLISRSLRAVHLQSAPIMLGTPLSIDSASLEAYCAERMQELGRAPVNAELRVEGSRLIVTEDSNGLVVSVDRLRQDLVRGLTGFTTPTINLTAALTPAEVQADRLETEVAALGSALQQPLRLYAESSEWEISPSQIAESVTLTQISGEMTVAVDDEAISELVDQIAGEIDRPVLDGHVDEAGLYGRIITPQDGMTVDRQELTNRVHLAILSGQSDVEIPVAVTPARGDIKTLMTEYGITDLIATGSSSFAGSDPGRSTNVRRAAELIDGTLVAPGDVFSFNQALGSITEVGGFVPAGASEGGIPGTSVGGGVCQLSTSVFRAALVAGLPITEWYPHAYRSMYYEQDGWAPGYDASIQQPDQDPLNGPDLKVRNTTEGWLLIRAMATIDQELKVSLFGTATGWDVELWDPIYGEIIPADPTPMEEIDDSLPSGSVELWQPARDGVTMIVHRTVYAADGSLLIDEDFVSMYQPQGPVYRVSSDMVGSAGAGW